jgi:hypothetical protein
MLWKLNFIIIWVLNSIIEFERKITNKRDLRKQNHSMIKNDTLPYRCQPQKWLTSEERERERENTPVKQQQGKAWATKAQQDLPDNVVINSWLLACKS